MLGILKAVKAVKGMKDKVSGARDTAKNPAVKAREAVQNWAAPMLGTPAAGQAGLGGGAPVMGAPGMGAPAGGAGSAPAAQMGPATQMGPAGGPPVGGGSNVQGAFQKAWTPDYLENSPLGWQQQQMLQNMMTEEGNSQRRFMNQDLANIRSSTQQQQQQFAGNARFRGSGVGAAIGQAVGQAGIGQESRRLAQADQEELQRKMMINQAITQGFTNPLYQSLGMGQTGFENMMSRSAADAAQPSMFEKSVGQVTGLVGAFMCWVARAVLQDERWVDARTCLIQDGSPYLVNLYAQHGEGLAERVNADPTLRAELLPVFEDMAARGAEIRHDRGGE